jgi:uncharacterized protein YecT (DUF1311 family)
MKRTALFVAVAAVAVLFSGCSLFSHKTDSSAVPAASFPSASSENHSQTGSSENPISSHIVTPAASAQSQPGRVLSIETDSQKFNRKFAGNPIDKAYIRDSDKAVSTVDMVNVSQKYAKVWKKEISHAYGELTKKMIADSSGKPVKLKAEQQKWEKGKDAALKKISSDALSGGGSMAEVDEASKTMDFYRSRAAQLYRELYDYASNYSYAYSSK